MAKYTFTVESDDLHEVADFINRANDAPRNTPEEAPAEEPAPAAKPTRARKAKAEEPPATAGEPTATATSAPREEPTEAAPATAAADELEEHPLLKEYSLADIKAKATELITAGGGEVSVKIVNNLKERFGAEGFGQLKPEDYSRCMAMLDEVAA